MAVDMNNWRQVYSFPMSDAQTAKITATITQAARELGYWCDNTAGDIIENRSSQVTYSALGQQAAPEVKYPWDPTSICPSASVSAPASAFATATRMFPVFPYGSQFAQTQYHAYVPGG